jgi:hypothetical protein
MKKQNLSAACAFAVITAVFTLPAVSKPTKPQLKVECENDVVFIIYDNERFMLKDGNSLKLTLKHGGKCPNGFEPLDNEEVMIPDHCKGYCIKEKFDFFSPLNNLSKIIPNAAKDREYIIEGQQYVIDQNKEQTIILKEIKKETGDVLIEVQANGEEIREIKGKVDRNLDAILDSSKKVLWNINKTNKNITNLKKEVVGKIDDATWSILEEMRANHEQTSNKLKLLEQKAEDLQCSVDDTQEVMKNILTTLDSMNAAQVAKDIAQTTNDFNFDQWRVYQLCRHGWYKSYNGKQRGKEPYCYVFETTNSFSFNPKKIDGCNSIMGKDAEYKYTITRNFNECKKGARNEYKLVDGDKIAREKNEYCNENFADVIVTDVNAAKKFLDGLDGKSQKICSGHNAVGQIKDDDKTVLYLACILPEPGKDIKDSGSFMTYKFKLGTAEEQLHS